MAATKIKATRLKPAICNLLQYGSKAASTTKSDIVPVISDYLCEVCRKVEFERLLIRPELNQRDLFGADPEEVLELVYWDLPTTRRSSRCPLCRFLLTFVSIPEELDSEQSYTICVWPQPIATYTYYGPMATWNLLLAPFLYAAKILGLPYRIFNSTSSLSTPMSNTIGWQLCIGLGPSSSAAEPCGIDVANEQNEIRHLHRQSQVVPDIPPSSRFEPIYPNGPRSPPGYRVHGRSNNSKALSYPTCRRDLHHGPSPVDHLSDIGPAHVNLPRTCVQLQARHSKGPMELRSDSYEIENIMKCRSIDPDRANFTLARQWQQFCSLYHEGFCDPLEWTPSSSAPFTLKVIDVYNECVVKAPRNCKYLALSYTWGKIDQLRATKNEPFTRPGALSNNSCQIPKTVSDAFIVCKNLNMRFLWVDRLCIIQDCDCDIKAQISHMGYVYGGAQLTIVAAYGDNADAGLPGVSDIARKRQQRSTQFRNFRLTTMPRNAFQALLDSPWYSRGWTFQELVLSKRLLAFTEEQMLFLCVKSLFREDLVLEARNGCVSNVQSLGPLLPNHINMTGHNFDLDDIVGNSLRHQQGLKSYENFLTAYLFRKLGNEADILNAFSGILEALFPYVGPFRWGLPVFCSSLIFQWRSNDRFPLRRRTGVPSWSWAGWKDYNKPVSFGWGCLGYSSRSVIAAGQPDLFVFTNQGQLTPIVYSTHLHGMRPHMDPIVLARLKKPYDQYVVFFADCVFLAVDRRPLEAGNDIYAIRWPHTSGEAGRLSLDPTWRKDRGDFMEFVLIKVANYMGMDRYKLMPITRDGPVASRIQVSENEVTDGLGLRDLRRELVILE